MGINISSMRQSTQPQQSISLSQSTQPQYDQQPAQPQYSQPQYNQPQQSTQPQYNQSQYNQPQYGQPQYSQPQYPQSQTHHSQPRQHSQSSVSLRKGQKVDLTKTNPGLRNIIVGLGWDVSRYNGGYQFDLDSAAFLLSPTGKVDSSADFVFYNNKSHISGSVVHTGDNQTGAGDGDDEQIKIFLDRVPPHVNKIAFTVTIDEAQQRQQNFGQVSNAYIRIFNADTNEELLYYDLDEEFSIETAIVVAEIYRYNGEWKFNAIGSGYQGGLAALCNSFGIDVN